MDELLKMLYDTFYEPLPEPGLKQSIKENHRQLIERLEKPERKLVLRIIDAQDQITEVLSWRKAMTGRMKNSILSSEAMWLHVCPHVRFFRAGWHG